MVRRLWFALSLLWLAFWTWAALTGFMADDERVFFLAFGLTPWVIKYVFLWIIRGNGLASRLLLK